jgi:hypothetical protein
MRTSSKTLLAVLVLTLVSGCATQIKDIGSYRPAPMADTDVMPTPEQLEAKRTKVLVFEADDKAVRDRLNDAGVLKARKIEEVLSGSSVEIVDRSLAMKLRDEIALAEAKGDGSTTYSGPEVASVAVRSFITDVGAGSKYTPASQYEYKGKLYQVAHSCNYTGYATGGMRFYEVPSLRLMGTFALKGNVSVSENAYCRNDQGVLLGLARQAVEDSVHRSRADIKNMFAPKGYVVEKRVMDKNVIFKVMVGKTHGAASQDKLTFYTVRKNENRLTKKVEFEEMPITTGVLSDQIGEDFAWIVPDDLDKARQIRLGDFVKIVYKKGFFD